METKHEEEYKRIADCIYPYWMIRVADVKELTKDKLNEYLRLFNGHNRPELNLPFIASTETSDSGKLHFHIIHCDINKDSVTDRIKQVWPDAKGNKCIYVKKAHSLRQALKYVVKDGDFIYEGLSKEFVEDLFQVSHQKIDIIAEIVKLEEQIILGEIEFIDFIDKYVELKASIGPIYTQHLVAYFLGISLRTGHTNRRNYSMRIFNTIFDV